MRQRAWVLKVMGERLTASGSSGESETREMRQATPKRISCYLGTDPEVTQPLG